MRFFSILLAAGCSDYEMTPHVDGDDVPGHDDPEPEAAACDPIAPSDYEAAVDPDCNREPEIGSFDPVIEWTWTDNPVHPGYQQIMASPSVGNLTDDDGNGVIDGRDVPDVVFTAFAGSAYGSPGAVIAISGADGSTLWSVASAGGHAPQGASGVAIADLAGDGRPAVLVATASGLLCLDASGAFRWHASVPASAYGHPAVGDLEGDGLADIAFGASVVGHDGTVRWTGSAGTGTSRFGSFLVDLDGDGLAELVAGNTVYEHDGSIRWSDGGSDGWPALGDFDADGAPEIVKVVSSVEVALHDTDGTWLWSFTLDDGGGGPPTVADFDGDGEPEVGLASRSWYRVIDTGGTELWRQPVQDYSSSVTGSSVFDFEGDGAAEVVYADEETLWIYDGSSGTVEMAWDSHASGTLFEYPLVVDVDADDAAEIVVASNDYAFAGSRGITAIGDLASSWAPARRVWNQHAYFISNVHDDGTASSEGNWTAWNSFRAGNSESALGLDLPDLVTGPPEVCTDECPADRVVMWLPVENRGLAPAVSVELAVYRAPMSAPSEHLESVWAPVVSSGDGTWLGPVTLYRDQFAEGGGVLLMVDDGTAVDECDESNNGWRIPAFPCDQD